MSSPTHGDSPLAPLWHDDSDVAGRVAVRTDTAVLTHAELKDSVRATATLLQDAGVRSGDLVAITCPGTADWLVAFCGTLWAGAVAVLPVADDLDRLLVDEDIRAVIQVAAPELEKQLAAVPVPSRNGPRPPPPSRGIGAGVAGAAALIGCSGALEVALTWADLVHLMGGRTDDEPRDDQPGPDTVVMYTLPPAEELDALVGTCLRVLAAGGSVDFVDFVDSVSSPAVLDLLARRRATDLVAAAPVLTAVRRRIEAELAVSPIHVLAVFEALQHDPARPPADRRRLLAGALLADRDSRLVRLHSCGTPLDQETVRFFVRMGMAVLASPAKRAGPA